MPFPRAPRMKNGAPIRATMTPTGTSDGASTRRETTSAPHTQAAPTTIDQRAMAPCRAPTTRRTMSGTARPTNVRGPPRAVAPPASAVTATTPSTRISRTRTPRLTAASSPSARTPSAEVMRSATTAPTAITAPVLATEAMSTPSNDPDAQYRNSLKAYWFAARTA